MFPLPPGSVRGEPAGWRVQEVHPASQVQPLPHSRQSRPSLEPGLSLRAAWADAVAAPEKAPPMTGEHPE